MTERQGALLPNGDPRRALIRPADSLKRMADLITVALSLLLVLSLLWLLSDVILLLFAATLLACQLAGAAAFLSRRTPLSYTWALVLVLVGGSATVGLFVCLHGPVLVSEVTNVFQNVNEQIDDIWKRLGNIDALKGTIERVCLVPRDSAPGSQPATRMSEHLTRFWWASPRRGSDLASLPIRCRRWPRRV